MRAFAQNKPLTNAELNHLGDSLKNCKANGNVEEALLCPECARDLCPDQYCFSPKWRSVRKGSRFGNKGEAVPKSRFSLRVGL